MSILIKDAWILTQDKTRRQIHGDIYIEDTAITQISEKSINVEADFKINGNKKLVMPGLINMHTHIPMTLLRGYGDDMVLNQWLEERIWPIEAKLNSRYVSCGTKLGLLEMISSGTTMFLDMYFFEDTIGVETEKAGLRGYLGSGILDYGTPEYPFSKIFSELEHFIDRWKNHELIKPVVAPHGTYTCNPENLRKANEIADKYELLLHIHCSETRDEVYSVQNRYGKRPVEILKDVGLLNKNMILAHCGWITKGEILDIKRYGSSVVHCPVSNMKIATGGVAPIPELLSADVTVTLGTDGAASNNTLDMFETMKFAALLQKQYRWDPQILPAQTVFDLATINGAKALHIDHLLGSIEEGKKADIIIIDLNKPRLTPCHDPVSHIVYAANGDDVYATIVNGEMLMLNREFFTLQKENIVEDAIKCAEDLTTSS